MTYVEKPEHLKDLPFSELQVNHIDGNKQNNNPSNLEWCTAAENVRHSHDIGLHKRSYKIDVKDVVTESILEFNSAEECARYYQVPSQLLFKYIQKSKPFKTIHGFAIFKFHEDPWLDQDTDQIMDIKHGLPIPIVAFDTETSIKHIFNGMSSAARALGYSFYQVRRCLLKKKQLGKWKFEILSDLKLLPKNLIEERNQLIRSWKRAVQKPVPITVTNIENGEIRKWNSCQEFADSVGVKKNTVQCMIKRNNGIFRNWNIVYKYDRYGRSK